MASVCTVPGCKRKYNAKGYCGPHYAMWQRHGDPLYADKGLHISGMNALKCNTIADFWKKVRKRPNGCWEWQGGRDQDGYGMFSWHNKPTRVNRFVAGVIQGLDIDGMEVCHTCDNPPCANPAHLYVGTVQSNKADSVAKMRHAHGERCHTAKLTVTTVREIRAMVKRGMTRYAAAKLFNISWTQADNVVRRVSWKHVK